MKNKEKNTCRTSIPIFFLLGPTCCYKTEIVEILSKKSNIKPISVDSVSIYKKMNIGSAKPSIKKVQSVAYGLLNVCEPDKIYSAAQFKKDAYLEIYKAFRSDKIPFFVGGTMLYFNFLFQNISLLPTGKSKLRDKISTSFKNFLVLKPIHYYLSLIDPVLAYFVNSNNLRQLLRYLEIFLVSGKIISEIFKFNNSKLHYSVYQFGVFPKSIKILYKRIENRFFKMLNLGLEQEIWNLYQQKQLNVSMPSIRSVGYKQFWKYFNGQISYNETVERSICATQQIAKKQINWLKKWKNIKKIDDNVDRSVEILLSKIQALKYKV